MKSERKVNISIHPDFISDLTRPRYISDKSYMETIGYMALWGDADIIDLFVARDGEITGLYYRKTETGRERYFTMGGIPDRQTGKYSTHS